VKIQKSQIFLVGHFPPRIGGVSIHLAREFALLQQHFHIRGFDMAGDREESSTNELCRGPTWRVIFKLLAEIVSQRPRVVHFHISAGRNAPVILLMVAWAAFFSKTVLTIHSGSFPAYLKAVSRWRRFCFRRLFNTLDLCIGVSRQITDAIAESFPKVSCRYAVIPAFIAVPRKQKNTREKRDYIIASGYATKTYDWMCLLDAVEKTNGLKRLDMVFYNTYHSPYYEQVRARIREIKDLEIRMFNDLPQDVFQTLLLEADILVRPTLNDGDAVVIREALAAGLFVIASDAAVRPRGVHLFPTSDPDALAQCLDARASFPETEIPANEVDFSTPLLRALQALACIPGDVALENE
jgi:glycosyltransferase involved in cell wall biosynthesis